MCKTIHFKVRQLILLQSAVVCCYKVRQLLLQSAIGIKKCDRTLRQKMG